MGTWGTGPFDNDTAADFACAPDDAAGAERVGLVRDVLDRALRVSGRPDLDQEAVAAAALIAAQCPGGPPGPFAYGPDGAMPVFPDGRRLLADDALARVSAGELSHADTWATATEAARWAAEVRRLRIVLDPPPPSIDVPLFPLEG